MPKKNRLISILGMLGYIFSLIFIRFIEPYVELPHIISFFVLTAGIICLILSIASSVKNTRLGQWKRRVILRKAD